jgi:opacity protein-like surface antigen
LFNKTFSLETGVSYTHSDRRQLTLNGFLALDAIFLGSIKLDRVKSDITQLDVTGRYGVTDRLQFDFNAPFLYRSSTYETGGVGSSASTLGEQTVNKTDIGDVSAGAYYRLFAETPTRPDIVLNVRVKAPTGKNPYGIKFSEVNSVSTPSSIPTGNGLWALSTGLTFVKTVDPAILFASVGYTHNFSRKFDDISSATDSPSVPGEIDLGDAYQVAGGLAFALNEKMSLSMSYAHRFSERARINQGTAWQSVIGSDASAGSLNFGVTYAMSDKLSMVASVAMGVTPDAPDVTVGVKFPYNF